MFRACGLVLTGLMVLIVTHAGGGDVPSPIPLGSGVSIRNVEEPFNYFTNPWTLIGLKDYLNGTRISPKGELVLADGLLCQPLIGQSMVPLNWRVARALQKGCLPVVRFDFVANDTLRYTLETFACPLEPAREAGSDSAAGENFLNLLRVSVRNLKATPQEAHFGLGWKPKKGQVACEVGNGVSENAASVLSSQTVLCVLQLPDAAQATARGSRVTIETKLDGRSSAGIVACIPYRPVSRASREIVRALCRIGFDERAARETSYWETLLARGMRLEVPEDKPMNVYRASLVYQFITRDRGDVHPGEGFYDNLYLRDGAYQAISLAHAGYLDAARESLEYFFRYQRDDGQFVSQKGQLDANGYAIWALVEYYRLSHDEEWLRRVYPALRKSAAWIQEARRRENDPQSPFFGVLPAAPADGENLWGGKHHIVGYDWWNLRGIQSAAAAARALGNEPDAARFAKEFDDYRGCILRAIEKTDLAYIPPSYEKVGTHWGNLEAVFPTLLMDPHDPRMTATLQFVRNEFGGGFREGTIQWSPPQKGAIHPYMSQFVTNSHIIRGDHDEAIADFYSFLLHTTSTHGFPEGVYPARREAWGNTLPHLWAAALYVTTLRNMLIREQGEDLHVLSCVPVHWLDAGKRIRVEKAPTHFGKASFVAAAERDTIRLRFDPPVRFHLRTLYIHAPKGIEIVSVDVEGAPLRVAKRETVILNKDLPSRPPTITMHINRTAHGPAATFESRVAEYKANMASVFKPIPGLVSLPQTGEIDARKCVKIDLRRFANTNALAAPFNVPNPGKYTFAGLPLGDRTVSGVPFHIIDPVRNEGKSMIVFNGANACSEFPREIDVPVNARGRYLCVLGNVTGWAGGDPGVGEWGAVGEYEIRYADGATQRIPLISGRTVDDWAAPPNATEVVAGLQDGIWHLNLLTIALEPRPVASIRIRDLGTPASPLLAAMTIVK